MNQFLADSIDQLDLAADQLAVSDRNFDRFALMLVDNAIELLLHRSAQEKASENELWTALKQPKYDPRDLDAALGRHFEAKVKFASKTGLMTGEVAESIVSLHAFRNTAYHRGLRHEGILHSLAVFYFRITCDLLKAYEPRVWMSSSNDVLSHRARKYLGNAHELPPREMFEAAFVRLAEVGGGLTERLVEDLAKDVTDTVDSLDEAIDFLATGGPEPMSRREVVVTAQAWDIAFTDDAKNYAGDHGCPATTVFEYVEWLTENYPWTFTSDPPPSWRSRISSLERETDYHAALKKYSDFMRQTEAIRTTVLKAAAQLDDHIQWEIDRARGK